MIFKQLSTDRLILKNIAMDDKEFIYSVFSDPDVTRHLYDEEPLRDVEGAEDIINMFLQSDPQLHHRWVIISKTSGRKMGTCGFHVWNKETAECELGYDLLKKYWGVGYMSEALKSIIAFGRDVMELKQIHAHIFAENYASIRLAEKMGFKKSGEYNETQQGITYPHYIYTLHF